MKFFLLVLSLIPFSLTSQQKESEEQIPNLKDRQMVMNPPANAQAQISFIQDLIKRVDANVDDVRQGFETGFKGRTIDRAEEVQFLTTLLYPNKTLSEKDQQAVFKEIERAKKRGERLQRFLNYRTQPFNQPIVDAINNAKTIIEDFKKQGIELEAPAKRAVAAELITRTREALRDIEKLNPQGPFGIQLTPQEIQMMKDNLAQAQKVGQDLTTLLKSAE